MLYGLTGTTNVEEQVSRIEYQALIETMREGVAVVRADMWIEYVNPQMARLLGYERPEEVAGRSASEFIDPRHWNDIQQEMNKRRDGVYVPVTLPLKTRDGTVLMVDVSATSLFDDQHGFTGILGLFTDQTEHHRLEVELFERRSFAQSLLDGSGDCIKMLDLDGLLLSMNTQGLDMMGVSDFAWIRGKPWTSFMHSADAKLAQEAINQAIAGRRSRCQLHVKTYGGLDKAWDVAVSPIRDVDGTVVRLLVISRDMTELLAAQQGERTQDQRNAQILESITDAFYAVDRDWKFTYVNAQAARLLQRTAAELVGQDGWEAFPEARGTIIEENYLRVMTERQSVHFEAYFAPLTTWFEIHAYPSGEGVAVTFQNINSRKFSERLEVGTNQILEMTVQAAPLGEILGEVALLIERQLPGSACHVMLHQADCWTTAAAPSLPDDYVAGFENHSIIQGMSQHIRTDDQMSSTVQTSVPLIVEDIAIHPAWGSNRDLTLLQGFRASLTFPVLSASGVCLGILGVYKREVGPFPEDTLQLMERMRGLMAVAVEHDQLRANLMFQAQHDPLSGLPNRKLFDLRLDQGLSEAHSKHFPLALAVIDLDDFKAINDVQGHLVGDAVIKEISRRLPTCLRRGDTLARIGGDEFSVILPYADEAFALQITDRILRTFEQPILVEGVEVLVSASIGISLFPTGGTNSVTLRRHADLAMYTAKTRKLGRALYEPWMNRRAAERAQLAQHLRRAIELNELELHYQPKVHLKDGTLVGVEALLRWRHPVLGVIPPLQFIPIAEETGLIISIGEWVLREACRQGRVWQLEGRPPVRMAVNVSALQFERDGFTQTVARALQDTGFTADSLELELTESAVMLNVDASSSRMSELRGLGVSLAIDDFGTGYSSLSYLSLLPLNVLKIDRSFVTELREGSTALPVIRAIINLAQSLGFTTVAEGIETPEQATMLLELGCTEGQGYLFSRPCPANELFRQDEGD
jgi:diguanylate cyclase (GGDEF)-like protein/PAS domain S-box-containing protein